MTPHDIQRRNLLRGFLAAGCALYLPVLAGCRDKELPRAESNPNPGKGPLPAVEVPPEAAPIGVVPPATTPGGKMTKADARYQDQPKGEQSCAQCTNFVPASNTCQLVEGQVSPQGWCSLWASKTT